MLTTYYPNGLPYIIEERVNGKRNGEVLIHGGTNELISIMEYDNGQILYIEYRQNDRIHNLHYPASMCWYVSSRIKYISYVQNGHLHNLYVPAFMSWDDNVQPYFIEYWQNGLRHNLHGPAYMEWYRNGQIYRIKYHHFGKLIKEITY